MKKAEEYVKDIHGCDLDTETTAILVKSYKEYAKKVAENALEVASENLYDCHSSLSAWESNKKDILNTEIITP